MSTKTDVLFVCLGNICRSTMAEGVFRSLTPNNPLIGTIDSCGTGAYHTLSPPDHRTMTTLRKNGITNYDHGARQVTEADFENFDYVFAMDGENLRDLEKVKRRVERKRGDKVRARVMLFGEFAGTGRGAEEVEDPYYGGAGGFDTAYEQVRRFSTNFLKAVEDGEAGGSKGS